jgi:hypothetical protein
MTTNVSLDSTINGKALRDNHGWRYTADPHPVAKTSFDIS